MTSFRSPKLPAYLCPSTRTFPAWANTTVFTASTYFFFLGPSWFSVTFFYLTSVKCTFHLINFVFFQSVFREFDGEGWTFQDKETQEAVWFFQILYTHTCIPLSVCEISFKSLRYGRLFNFENWYLVNYNFSRSDPDYNYFMRKVIRVV